MQHLKMFAEKFDHFQSSSNMLQQGGQHVQHDVPNNVAICYVEMWSFGQGFIYSTTWVKHVLWLITLASIICSRVYTADDV